MDDYYLQVKDLISQKDLKKAMVNNLHSDINSIKNSRSKIDRLEDSLENSILSYNTIIKKLIHSISNISLISDNYELSRYISSYVSLIKAKEFSAIKRGMLTYSFSSNKFTAQQFSTFHTYQTLFDRNIEIFQSDTIDEVKDEFKKILQHDSTKEVKEVQNFIINKMIKNELISNMKALAGYGGLIHDFKNYVLRGDLKYQKRFKLKYSQLINSIKEYKKLKSTKDEIKFLRTVQFTFQRYEDKLIQIEQLHSHLDVESLDRLVKIDDNPAIEALEELSSSVVGIDSSYWFNIMSSWIDDLSYIENKLASSLFLKITKIQDDICDKLHLQLILTVIALLIVILLSYIIINDVLKKIETLKNGLVSFLDYVSKKTDQFSLLRISGSDELSSMAEVLNNSMEQTSKHIEQEISLAKQQERQIQESSKMARMGEMIGNIAHQWRQPLSAISTIASSVRLNSEVGILESSDIPKEMDKIVERSLFLSETINTFRDFINDDKEFVDVSLQQEIHKSLNIVQSTLNSFDINVINNIDKVDNITLKLIAGELPQVLMNILNNAKDIMIEKGIDDKWVKVELKKTDTHAVISIEDNGGGIPEDVMPKIFDPYFTTKHQSQGTGIGLYMSYDIIKDHLRGDMYVENTTNGAKFFIELPLDLKL